MPRGLQGAKKFANTKKLVDLLKKQAKSNKPYGAICASPAHVLELHGLLKITFLFCWASMLLNLILKPQTTFIL
ncbi:unnamed protein product [Urochloa humidicola]